MEEEKPLVSVVIPAYNAEKFIKRTINSVLRQSFTDFEVLVLDDGSRDSTGQIIREMQKSDKRIVYYSQDNRGLSYTRNRLIELSRGDFVAFLDHDDEWLTDKLKKQLQVFDTNPKAGIVFSDAYIQNNGKVISNSFKERRPFRGSIFYKYLFSDNFAPLLTIIIPKEIMLKFMPFSLDYEINEEFELFLRLAREYEFDYVDEPLAIYHVHGANTIISKGYKFIEESFRLLDHWIKNDPDIKTRYTRELDGRLAQLYCKKGLYYLSVNNRSAVWGAIYNSFKKKLLNIQVVKLTFKLLFSLIRSGKKHNVESAVCA